MKTVKLGMLAALGVWFVISLGCNGYSAVGEHMGEAQSENAARMTSNPLAGQATVAVDGINPRTSEQVMEKYYELQRQIPDTKEETRSLIDIEF